MKEQHTVIKQGNVYRLSWDGTNFHPEEYDLKHTTVYNDKGEVYCWSCGRFHDKSDFYLKKSGAFDYPCKACRKVVVKKYQQGGVYKKKQAFKRALKKGDKRFIAFIESIPESYFDVERFNIKSIPLEIVPEELKVYAKFHLGIGLKGKERESVVPTEPTPKKRGRKLGQKVGKYHKRQKGVGDAKVIKNEHTLDLSKTEECPVCNNRKKLSEFNSEFSYCCKECEDRWRSAHSATEDSKASLFVRDRDEVVRMLDDFEEKMRDMRLAAERCDTDAFIHLRNRVDFLRNSLDVCIHWKRGEECAHIYRIPVK